MNGYEEQGLTFDKAVLLAANDDLFIFGKTKTRVCPIFDRLLQVTRRLYPAANTGIARAFKN